MAEVKISKLKKITPAERIYEDICRNIESKQLKPGAKLLSETALVKLYKAKIYQVRQALQLLKEAELIYSVPKVGAFVAAPGEAGPESDGFFEEEHPEPAETDSPQPGITFKTGHNFPSQRAAWTEIIQAFGKRNCFCRVEMDYDAYAKELHPVPPPDVCECSRPIAQYQAGDMPLLNIRDFFLDCNNIRMKFLDDYSALSGYFTNLLFFNRRLLEKQGYSLPCYHDFAGQQEYLEYHLAAVAANHKFTAPASTQQPVTRMGKYLGMIFKALSSDHRLSENKFMDIFEGPCEELVKLRRKHRMSPPQKASVHLSEFLGGRTPFLPGTSSDVRLIRDCPNSDDFGIYPFFSIDSSRCLLALPLVIHAGTSHPIECIRLVEFLQQDFVQRKFAEQGFLPVWDELQPEFFQKNQPKNRHDEVIFFRSAEEHYITTNILNVELWDCILHGKSVKDALNNCRAFARAYLNMKMAPMQLAERQKWMEMYS